MISPQSFERPHHRRVAHLLTLLDGERLRGLQCWFGGGTALVLRGGEYRESLDVDFLVSDHHGYRALREALTGPDGALALLPPDQVLVRQIRDVRADQYGIRTMLAVDDLPIKFEIIREARIVLDVPSADDAIAGVATLTAVDLLAEKLLANADRWADDGLFSRDVLDIAMAEPTTTRLRRAIEKSEDAYGSAIRADLEKAIAALMERHDRLERCLAVLQFSEPRAVVWKRLRQLRRMAAQL